MSRIFSRSLPSNPRRVYKDPLRVSRHVHTPEGRYRSPYTVSKDLGTHPGKGSRRKIQKPVGEQTRITIVSESVDTTIC